MPFSQKMVVEQKILDDYTNTLLIGKLLKAANFRDASKSAILMMLQEEYSIPIAKHMATYASYMYINHLRTGNYKLFKFRSVFKYFPDYVSV